MKALIHSFLISPLDDGMCHQPCNLTNPPMRKGHSIHSTGAWVCSESRSGHIWRDKNLLPLPRINPWYFGCPGYSLVSILTTLSQLLNAKQNIRQCTNNITLRHMHVTIVAMEKISITYFEGVFVALIIQHTKCMCHIIICCHLQPVWLWHNFPYYLYTLFMQLPSQTVLIPRIP
jgi:hypothetical protein